jgi:hypothetical protein
LACNKERHVRILLKNENFGKIEEPYEQTSVKIADNLASIRTEYLQNTIPRQMTKATGKIVSFQISKCNGTLSHQSNSVLFLFAAKTV